MSPESMESWKEETRELPQSLFEGGESRPERGSDSNGGKAASCMFWYAVAGLQVVLFCTSSYYRNCSTLNSLLQYAADMATAATIAV